MIGETNLIRSRLKGYIFEIILKKLLKVNGFYEVRDRNPKIIKEVRYKFLEVRGRGGWHQIDCLCDYNVILPFMYPIRMLGEVKYHSEKVSKEDIREFIGIVKDIQENYFVSDNFNEGFNRVTELGVFFSINGFEAPAERLAFAHNIKTISYKNNYIIDSIKSCIEKLEKNYLYANECISEGNFNDFHQMFSELLDGALKGDVFRLRFKASVGIEFVLRDLTDKFKAIKSNFIASTSSGVFLHFIGESEFPNELFETTDEQECEVYYYLDRKGYYMTFTNDHSERRYFFTPPQSLHEAAFYGGNLMLNEKERIFKLLQISITIRGIKRNLTIRLNSTWLENARESID